jgi:eukaryotic translation initiation factor 2C
VLGADVTHPGRDSLEPSIAAVVGSTNQFGSGYAAEFSVQSGGQEIIADLHLMVKVSRMSLIVSNLSD